ncbi:MAG: hypothetical protein ACN6OB_01135 [Chryseobacterium jejuense]|uniref:hypothetical protein n=1 Tax=Chryseobacterium jejuense TaxID=445960 RepID=UPI003D117101
MNRIFAALLVLFLFIKGKGQAENINSGKYHPAKEHFETKYIKQEYSKYPKSQITIEKDKVIINVINSIEFPENLDNRFKLLLGSGLLNPMIINGSPIIKILAMDELPLLNVNPQTKRFKFWIFRTNEFLENEISKALLINSANPNEYYFELYNENADTNTSFNDFIEGAKLTYLGYGGIII